MKTGVISTVLLSLGLLAGPALSVSAQAPSEAVERLRQAESDAAIESAGLKPWYLKLDVQLYNMKGAPTEKGTFEQWWASPALYRTTYTQAEFSATELHKDGVVYRTKDAGASPEMLRTLAERLLHPTPTEAEVRDSTPELRKQTFGKVSLDCIMLTQPIRGVAYPPLGLFPTYCFMAATSTLRVSFDFGSELTEYTRFGTFQGKHVVLSATLSAGEVKLGSAEVAALTTGADIAGKLVLDDTLVKLDDERAHVAAGVMAGSVIKKVVPVYPAAAKERHASGTVILKAIIGRDGRIYRLRLLSTPDPDLAISAIAAVRQWTYKPYLLNGQPTEVDTTITVNFSFN